MTRGVAGPRLARGSAAGRRGRRHVVAAGAVLAYLVAAGVVVLRGEQVGDGGWLALHLLLLGAVSNAIVVWSEHFAAALLHTRPLAEPVALARVAVLNLGVLAVLFGVRGGRPALVAGGAVLVGAVVVLHVLVLGSWLRGGLAGRLGDTVWFYLAAGGALLAGVGLGVVMSSGGVTSADAYLAARLAHAHLNVLGWIGLAVIGTQFTLWPTVLRTRMVPGLTTAARWAFLLCVAGLAAVTAGLLGQRRGVALAGLVGYAAGLAVALGPFVATMRQRRPRGAAAWMLAAGIAWLAMAVIADLVALSGSDRVVDLDGRLGRLLPAVAVGFGLQVLTGALTFLLPVVWGRGAWGNRRLTRLLELAWPPRVVALNLGVALVVFGPRGGANWVGRAGWWLAGLGAGSFVLLAGVVLVWRAVEEARLGDWARSRDAR